MTMDWHLAQINVGTIKYPPDDERMSGFMNRLDEINALAEKSPGFVWRMQSESGNATDIDIGGGPLYLANMSLWQSVESLFEFVYKTGHRDVMIKRRNWFERPSGLYQALWWVPAGHRPTPGEGLGRVAALQENGPTPDAFNFQVHFPPPESDKCPTNLEPGEHCSGWD